LLFEVDLLEIPGTSSLRSLPQEDNSILSIARQSLVKTQPIFYTAFTKFTLEAKGRCQKNTSIAGRGRTEETAGQRLRLAKERRD
jgi:hypothetical protein